MIADISEVFEENNKKIIDGLLAQFVNRLRFSGLEASDKELYQRSMLQSSLISDLRECLDCLRKMRKMLRTTTILSIIVLTVLILSL